MRPPEGVRDQIRRWRSLPDARLLAFVALLTVLAGLAVPLAGFLLAAGLAVVALLAVVAWRPILATYLYLLALPFITGMKRGMLIPQVRLNEALLGLLLVGACLGGYLRLLRGERLVPRFTALDGPLVAFVVLSTAWPLAWLMLRGEAPLFSDMTAVFPVVKLVALFLLVRLTVHTDAQVLRCVRLIGWTGAVVALIAILQTLRFGPVVAMLTALWPDESGLVVERGTSLLGSPIATGDYIVISLALVVSCGLRGLLHPWERLVLGCVLGTGVLAAGQFSTWIAALVAAVVLLRRHPEARRRAVRFLPLAGLALLVGAPAFIGRLSGFGDGFGVPRSWLGRWDNLTTFYLPELGGFRFLLGVSPNSVLQAPETWREQIFLESGYLQFLWVGGVPLLLAFCWLSVVVLRTTRRLGARGDAVGACAAALEIAWWMVLVLSLIDIHIVLRGAGDLLFTLLAITARRSDDR
ncbi:MAG TPA: hypothetical protein VIL00_15835 [Pseudonocardiaceae bacterium]